MHKQLVTYTDFDGVHRQENVYFNLTRAELVDQIHLKDELEILGKKLEGDGSDRTLTQAEITEILEMVKKMAKLAYGVRSEDGKRFIKGEEVWTEFTQTAAYDAWIMELFQDVDAATKWMANIMPDELREAAAAPLRSVSNTNLPEETSGEEVRTDSQGKPWGEYTKAELLEMSDSDFQSVIDSARDGKNVPYQLLVLGTQRLNGAAGGTDQPV